MKKFHRMFTLLLALLEIIFCLTACGNTSSRGENGDDPREEIAKDMSIDNIVWNIEEGIVDGERYVLLDYTNNSDFTLVGFGIQFAEKANMTEEERSQFHNDMKVMLDIDESDNEMMEEFEELKTYPVEMYAESEMVVKPDETVSSQNCYYYSGYYYVTDIDHYSLVVPDIATIRYIDDAVVKTLYYDFTSGKHTADSKTEPAYTWGEQELANAVPKPDADYVTASESSEHFSFDVYGWSLEQFNHYVRACKDAGFTIDPSEHEGFYAADCESGYQVYLSYDEDDCSVYGSIGFSDE